METGEETRVGIAPEIIYTRISRVVEEIIENTGKYGEIDRLEEGFSFLHARNTGAQGYLLTRCGS